MNPPEGLGLAGEVAWNRALRELDLDGEDDLAVGAVETWCHAIDRVALIRKTWRQAGEPIVETFKNGLVGQSVLLRVLEGAERHEERLRRSLPKRTRTGRSAIAVMRPKPLPLRLTPCEDGPASHKCPYTAGVGIRGEAQIAEERSNDGGGLPT